MSDENFLWWLNTRLCTDTLTEPGVRLKHHSWDSLTSQLRLCGSKTSCFNLREVTEVKERNLWGGKECQQKDFLFLFFYLFFIFFTAWTETSKLGKVEETYEAEVPTGVTGVARVVIPQGGARDHVPAVCSCQFIWQTHLIPVKRFKAEQSWARSGKQRWQQQPQLDDHTFILQTSFQPNAFYSSLCKNAKQQQQQKIPQASVFFVFFNY